MEKMTCESPDLTQANIARLAQLFPSVVSEARGADGKLKKAVNFEALRQLMSSEILEGNEGYEFTWVGKKAAIIEAGRPIRKTLRPCPRESKNWDTTENLYIEGDNLDVLKLLQENYLGKVKMIYIDPPYNTGNDFIYCDNFAMGKDDYQQQTGEIAENEDGARQRLFRNSDSNGRFHSDWCSMMYPRLMLARNLLSENGIIFISIADSNDNTETHNIHKICDEIFGPDNFLCQAIWDLGTGTTAGHFTRAHEYIFVYAKNKKLLPNFSAISDEPIVHGALKKISKSNPATEITFPAGFPFDGDNAIFTGVLGSSEQEFIISDKMEFQNGKLVSPTTICAGWAMANQIRNWIAGKETWDSKGQKVIRFWFNKQGILFYEKERGTYNPKSVLSDIGSTKNGSSELENMFGAKLFDFPKPVSLLKFLLLLGSQQDSLILDFFSGSATTAHAVMQLNAEDGGRRKFIMAQLPEECGPATEAARAGYKNICEIGKERIRRAGEKIRKDNADKPGIENLDIGFRVLKCDSSNMKDVYYTPTAMQQGDLRNLVSNIKEERTDLDLLFGCLVEWGLPLSLPCKTEEICGHAVHFYDYARNPEDNTALVACFDANINENAIKEIAKRRPLRAVFRDASFVNSQSKINAAELFKNYAPEMEVRVI